MGVNTPIKLDICLCTHNPDDILVRKTLFAIACQKVDRRRLSVLVVDNASTPPLDRRILQAVDKRGIDCRLIREERLGLAHARARAIRETNGELILFVDDDNELSLDYARHALSIAEGDPSIGCFGGKALLPDHVKPPGWITDYIRFLAVRDDGEVPITRLSPEWGPWEPMGAGAVVRRKLALLYLDRMDSDSRIARLGRIGRACLSCGEDNLMMRGASQLELKSSYQPNLVLTHHVSPDRFKLEYLLRLLFWFGRSEVVLSCVMRTELYEPWKPRNWHGAIRDLIEAGASPVNILCTAAINLGKWVELRRSGRDLNLITNPAARSHLSRRREPG